MSAAPTMDGALAAGLLPTVSGRWVDPFDLRPDSIAVEDMIFGLANECRWTSQVTRFYSVAQHAEIVSRNVPAALAFAGLLHDASEAWLGDLAPQFKSRWPDYLAAERRAMDAVADRFGLPRGFEHAPEIAEVDAAIRLDELLQLKGLKLGGVMLGVAITPLPPAIAAGRFYDRFFELWRAWGC